MFDVGFTELLLIGVVSLVVIGPERLPDVARTAGKWIGKLQRFVRGVKTDIANELDSGELKKLIGDQRDQIDELRKMVGSTKRDIESSTHDIVRGARKKLTELEDAAARADGEADADTDVERPPAPSTPPVPPAPSASPAASAPAAGSAAAAARTIGRRAYDADGAPVAAEPAARAASGASAGTPSGSSSGESSDPTSSSRALDTASDVERANDTAADAVPIDASGKASGADAPPANDDGAVRRSGSGT